MITAARVAAVAGGGMVDDEDEDGDEIPSKSARKRAAHAAQRLGERLIGLRESDLDALDLPEALPEALREALREARRIGSRSAGARQRQYIGRLMRRLDTTAIAAALDARASQLHAPRPIAHYNAPMKALVGIIMGSASDWETMQSAADTLAKLGVPHEVRVVSAHRTPDLLFEYASTARARGLEVIIAGAGGAAHLPGMAAAKTTLPVLGVPVQSRTLNGVDSLLSIVQMPAGVPVATFAIGPAGATNAALQAAAILALRHRDIATALEDFRAQQTERVLASPDPRAVPPAAK